MIPNASVLIAAAVIAAASIAGWSARGFVADAEMVSFKQSLYEQAEAQRELKTKVEAAQAVATDQSTQRLDQQAEQQQKVIVYVDKEVVRYRDRWRDSACTHSTDWVRLFNDSLFGPAGSAVPRTR